MVKVTFLKKIKIEIFYNKIKKKIFKIYEDETKTIVDIIPSLKAIKIDKSCNDENIRKQDIENKFRDLYKKAERLATTRMGHTYDGKNSLYDRYGNSLTLMTMRNEFEGYDSEVKSGLIELTRPYFPLTYLKFIIC